MLGHSILVSLTTLIVSVLSFCNQIIFAKIFGVSATMDAYLIGASLPTLVSGVVSAALNYSLVPALLVYKADDISYRLFCGLMLLGICIISIAIAGFGYIFSPLQIKILGNSLPSLFVEEAIDVARISWITAALMITSAFLTGILNSRKIFLLPVALTGIPFTVMIIGTILFYTSYSILSSAIGLLLGFILIIPVLYIKSISSFEFAAESLRFTKNVLKYFSNAPLIIIAMLSFTCFQFIDSYWAPQLGIGYLAYLGYSQRILVGIGTLIISGPSALISPRLALAYSEGRNQNLLQDTLRALRLIIACSVPLVLVISVFANTFVQILFERGEFDKSASRGVASILPMMLMGMVPMLCMVIVFRAMYAKHYIKFTSIIGVLVAFFYFIFSGFLSQIYGIIGISTAYTLTWWIVLFIAILFLWREQIHLLICKDNLLFIGKILILGMLIIVSAVIAKLWININTNSSDLFLLKFYFVVSLVFIINIYISNKILKIPEVILITNYINKKITFLFKFIFKKL